MPLAAWLVSGCMATKWDKSKKLVRAADAACQAKDGRRHTRVDLKTENVNGSEMSYFSGPCQLFHPIRVIHVAGMMIIALDEQ